jgi:biopolymer transport protein TolR
MSMQAGGGGGASGGGGSLSNEPNVTPMIDVLLVLLIIFMAVLPSMRKAIDIQLPDPNPTVAPANSKSDQIVLEIKPGGDYEINTKKVTHDQLGQELHDIFAPRNEKIMFVKGVPGVKYAAVMDAMDIARGAGIKILGITPKDTPGGTPAAK